MPQISQRQAAATSPRGPPAQSPGCRKPANTLETCTICSKPIMERILRATGKAYHPHCFTCVVCHRSLDGIPFTVDASNHIHCIEDFHKKFAPRCCVCSEPIMPAPGQEETVRIVALDRDFHVQCYRCESQPHMPQAGSERRLVVQKRTLVPVAPKPLVTAISHYLSLTSKEVHWIDNTVNKYRSVGATSWEPSVQTFKEYLALASQREQSSLTSKHYECAVESGTVGDDVMEAYQRQHPHMHLTGLMFHNCTQKFVNDTERKVLYVETDLCKGVVKQYDVRDRGGCSAHRGQQQQHQPQLGAPSSRPDDPQPAAQSEPTKARAAEDGAALSSTPGTLNQAIKDVEALVDKEVDGSLHSVWLMADGCQQQLDLATCTRLSGLVDHWNNEKERLVMITDNSLLVCKYDFVMFRCEQIQRIPLNFVDRISFGTFTFPKRSVLHENSDRKLRAAIRRLRSGVRGEVQGRGDQPGTHGAAELKQAWQRNECAERRWVWRLRGAPYEVASVTDCLKAQGGIFRHLPLSSEYSVFLLRMLDDVMREGEGVRVFWDRLREPSFTSRWNPFATDYPFITFTYHPVRSISDTLTALCDIQNFREKLKDAAQKVHATKPVPGKANGVLVLNQPIHIEAYVGLIFSLPHPARSTSGAMFMTSCCAAKVYSNHKPSFEVMVEVQTKTSDPSGNMQPDLQHRREECDGLTLSECPSSPFPLTPSTQPEQRRQPVGY
ncbi:hypothetical protein INR49_008473 [Caranx melampygus]|nr:hypothetical protein INR49_008473 [Caranx melampygus]